MEVAWGQDPINGIWRTAREVHYWCGCPPHGSLGPHGRSRGRHIDPDTPHDQADAIHKIEARRHQAMAGSKLRGRRRRRCKVPCHKHRPQDGGRRSKETIQKLQPQRKDMVRKAIDRDNRQNHTPGPTIGLQIWTGVVKDLMALVGEKHQSRAKSPPSTSEVAS